ncbi:MAG: hypothetical protein K8S56_07555, partial [Candidatus Cloacimonetes bacterium]|nr:hypothetical protein [Candidatus Cloacimonadota bacterium]
NFIKAYSGNYRATFGEGLVMENTDYFSSRKTGYGFSKRITGIIGDLSHSQEYALRGGAIEWKRANLNIALFGSFDKKDVLLYNSNDDDWFANDDDKNRNDRDMVFSYITMSPRPIEDKIIAIQGDKLAAVRDALEETLLGTHLEYSPIIGTHIGFTAYEARYNRHFYVPETEEELKKTILLNQDSWRKFKLPDTEILSLYSTKTSTYERDYRRVYGLDWRTVLDVVSFQGEYAEMERDGNIFKIGDDPKAIIASAHTQFDNLNFLILFRDYDLNFDNPYSRGFAEHEKFDDTVFDKYAHELSNPVLAELYVNSAQAQAEKGIYFQTRYQFSRYFTLTSAYIDMWERKCDLRKSVRFQGELEFRPIFALRLRLKYKHQANRYDDSADRAVSITNETTGKVRAILSRRDYMSFEYRYTAVDMPPYPYLANDPEENGQSSTANTTTRIHGDFINVDYTHVFNKNLKVKGAFNFWNGHGVSHWDYEDMEIDFMGEQGVKYWFTVIDRISANLFLSVKFKWKRYKTKELDFRTWANEPADDVPYDLMTVHEDERAVRIQIDWKY